MGINRRNNFKSEPGNMTVERLSLDWRAVHILLREVNSDPHPTKTIALGCIPH